MVVRVMVELRHNGGLEAAAMPAADTGPKATDLVRVAGVTYDLSYQPVQLPTRVTVEDPAHGEAFLFDPVETLDFTPAASTYIVRATADEDKLDDLRAHANVVGVYADVGIEPVAVCPGSPPIGDAGTVRNLLGTAAMAGCGMDGAGVLVAVVDTGFNLQYLRNRGVTANVDLARSWSWDPAVATPGSVKVDHGTMCAFDVCLAAPKCTLIDVALLHPIGLQQGLLSDAVRAYAHLLQIQRGARVAGENPSLVVTNSWGMFHPSWDLPVSDPGNYSHNLNHPFNRIVADLERAGADILFAAGNCGAACPDGRCSNPPGSPPVTNIIYGANSHPAVLSVGGVDTTKTLAGYSTNGPGALTKAKPDLCGYTHFAGSGVYAADGGTSAATPVVAGVVAAVRSKRPYNSNDAATFPAAVRNLMTSTAEDLGPSGFDFMHGHGVVNGTALQRQLCRPLIPLPNLCERFPWLCDPCTLNPHSWACLCRRFPWLCLPRPVPSPLPPRPPVPPIPPLPDPPPFGEAWTGTEGDPAAVMAGPGSSAEPDADFVTVLYNLVAVVNSLVGDAVHLGPTKRSMTAQTGCSCGCK